MQEAAEVRRLAAEVEEDEQLEPSLCHAVFVDHLRGPLADRVAELAAAAAQHGDLDRARGLVAGYWELVDLSLVPAARAVGGEALLAAATGAGPAEDALAVFADAAGWRRLTG